MSATDPTPAPRKSEGTLEAVHALMGDRQHLAAVMSGSALYGTGGADSDEDVRCAFLPSKVEILTGNPSFGLDSNLENKRLGSGDVDVAGVTLMRYLILIGRLDMITTELLYASRIPAFRIGPIHPVFDLVWQQRDKLLAGTASAAVGHARQRMGAFFPEDDASLTPVRAAHDILAQLDVERIADAPEIIAALADIPGIKVLSQPADRFSAGRGWDKFTPQERETGWVDNKPVFVIIAGKKILVTNPMKDVLRVVTRPLDRADENKRVASRGTDIVWKDAYQGVRLIHQAIELYEARTLTFPRPEAPLLRQIRNGDLSVAGLTAHIAEKMDELRIAEAKYPFRAEACKDTTLDIICQAHEMVVRQ